MNIINLDSDVEFESLIKSNSLVVVDFYSDDCPPCEKFAPIYRRMADSFLNIQFVKVFRQQHRELAASLGVSSSPTVLFVSNRKIQDLRFSGEIKERDFKAALEKISGQKSAQITKAGEEECDLCIIGNGPAGMTAAIYAARYKISQILVGDMPGGLMTSSHKICNFPSQVEISGMDLSRKMAEQVNALEVHQENARVTSVDQIDKTYRLTLSNNKIILARAILIATGTKHRHLGLPNEDNLQGRGISYCATCDAMFYKDKVVAVVGGSDSANTAALYLAQLAKKVYQIYRGDSLRGETAWIDQIKTNEKISVIYNTQVTELIGSGKLTGIKIDTQFAGHYQLDVDGLFVEVGSEPDLDLINQLSLDIDKGYYIITKENQATSRDGVWAAGDITTNSNSFRQIITACAEGAIAAESIFKYLQKSR